MNALAKTIVLFFIFFSISQVTKAQCVNPANIYAFNYNGKTYEVVKENKNWITAAACASSRGGILAEINNLAEQNAIYTQLNSNAAINNFSTTAPDGGGGAYVWLGGNDLAVEGNWIWDGNNDNITIPFWIGTSSGSAVGGLYSNWGNEPDNFNGQDALGISLNGWPLGVAGQWNDVDHTNSLYSIIEYPGIVCSTVNGIDVQNECINYTWINGQTYTTSNNTAKDTLIGQSSNGCDSIVTLNLTINNPNTGTDTRTECSSHTWIDGINYTANNNTATHTLMNLSGCDSVVTLNLTIANPNTGIDTKTECENYTWIDAINYTANNNTATHTLMNLSGCDSIVTLNLTILEQSTGIDSKTECENYTWIDGLNYAANNNTATHTLMNESGCDSIVTLNLTILEQSTGIDSKTECENYTWIDGISYAANNNTASHTLTNVAGCDSIVSLNLTITTIDVQTTVTANTIVANQAGASYKWLDCNKENEVIENEIMQEFTAKSNGSYAVEITNGSCVDTSECIAITSINISDFFGKNLTLYPNPTAGKISIDLGNIYTEIDIEISDLSGKIIQTQKNKNSKKIEMEFLAPKGIYILKIKSNNEQGFYKILKK